MVDINQGHKRVLSYPVFLNKVKNKKKNFFSKKFDGSHFLELKQRLHYFALVYLGNGILICNGYFVEFTITQVHIKKVSWTGYAAYALCTLSRWIQMRGQNFGITSRLRHNLKNLKTFEPLKQPFTLYGRIWSQNFSLNFDLTSKKSKHFGSPKKQWGSRSVIEKLNIFLGHISHYPILTPLFFKASNLFEFFEVKSKLRRLV